MTRVPEIDFERLTPDQKRLYEAIGAARNGVPRGPFAVWMHRPEIADVANRFGNALRLEGRLDRRLFEITTLIIARHWSAQYEWFAHEEAALQAGVSVAVVEAIRNRRIPDFARDDEKLVYELLHELHETRSLSEQSYRRAVAALGLDLMIELATVIGFYTTAAIVINIFDAPVPGGKRPLP